MRVPLSSLLVLSLVACFIAGEAGAQITLDRVVIGSPGGTMSNGPLRMDLTIGQTAAGVGQSGSLEGDLGFWWEVPASLVAVERATPPARFDLDQNAPNPFASSTTIRYAIPAGQHVPVFVGVYNLQGALVKTLVSSRRDPGEYRLSWDGRGDDGTNLSAGIYFVRIHAGSFQRTRKLALLK